jgi:polyhydroxyalkanoate synthesis repressor PhaR
MTLVKRYPNRKLYDVERKRYIRLSEIADLIRQGKEVKVIDSVTREDLTARTLSRSLVEKEKRRGGAFPKSFFTWAIQRGGDVSEDSLLRLVARLEERVTFLEKRLARERK